MNNNSFYIQEINSYLLREKSKINLEIGEKIKEQRTKRKITVNEFSNRTLTSPSYITQIEKGEYSISLLKFITFCNGLDIDYSEILDDFILGGKKSQDLLYQYLQTDKNISKNIFSFMKNK